MPKQNPRRFEFSRTQRREIETASGTRAPELLHAIEDAVSKYQRRKRTEAQLPPMRREAVRTELMALNRAAERLQKKILGASEEIQDQVLNWSGQKFLYDLSALITDARYWIKQRHRPGKKPDYALRELDGEVAIALQGSGVRLTKGRDGRLARCLLVIRDAAGASVPENMLTSLQMACKHVDERLLADRLMG